MTQTVLRAVVLPDWPFLGPPAKLGGITAAQVQGVPDPDPDQLADKLQARVLRRGWSEGQRVGLEVCAEF